MRHRIAGNRLNRHRSLFKATIRDLAKATIIKERICTTHAKAKEARKLVDQLITLGKRGTLADRREAFSILCDHKLVSDLFNKTALRFRERLGGYSRVVILGKRRGDNAQMVFLELTEKTQVVVHEPRPKEKKEKIKKIEAKPKVQAKSKSIEKSLEPEAATEKQQVIQEPKQEQPKEEKPIKKEPFKSQPKSLFPAPDKGISTKKFMGGLKKIFQRKSPGQ